jgi:asparagine synthetase B (glutamine-hydrolysing)
MMPDMEGQAPFIHLKRTGNTITAAGSTSYAAGHKLPHRTERTLDDGIFVEWSWDGRRLRVRNDRYGVRPCFYFAAPGEICVSPSIPRLLDHAHAPLEFDDGAMAVFLRFGSFIGEDTPFEAVRALPPGAALEWTAGRLATAVGGARHRA